MLKELITINKSKDAQEIVFSWEEIFLHKISLEDIFSDKKGLKVLSKVINAYNNEGLLNKSVCLIERLKKLYGSEIEDLHLSKTSISVLYLDCYLYHLNKKKYFIAYLFLLESGRYRESDIDDYFLILKQTEEVLYVKRNHRFIIPFIVVYVTILLMDMFYNINIFGNRLLLFLFSVFGIILLSLYISKKIKIVLRKILIFFDIPRLYIHGRWGSGWF